MVLRDPVERVLSLASYIMANPHHGKHAELLEQDLALYLARRNIRYTQFANAQVRHLAGRNCVLQNIGPRRLFFVGRSK